MFESRFHQGFHLFLFQPMQHASIIEVPYGASILSIAVLPSRVWFGLVLHSCRWCRRDVTQMVHNPMRYTWGNLHWYTHTSPHLLTIVALFIICLCKRFIYAYFTSLSHQICTIYRLLIRTRTHRFLPLSLSPFFLLHAGDAGGRRRKWGMQERERLHVYYIYVCILYM